MRRGGPLQRHTPLARGGPLKRTPFKASAATPKPSRPKPAVPPTVRAALKTRSGGRCEIQLPDCCCGMGIDPSHRITTKSGGRHGVAKLHHDRLSDVTFACRPCHEWVTDEPANALSIGLALKEGADSAVWPVQLILYDAGLVLLDDDGGVFYPDGTEVAR